MTKQESAALNMAKFNRAQSLLLLEKLDVLDLDDEAADCERMHEHTPPRGDMIAVGHSECEQYFVLFNIVLCSSMFFDVHRQG
ncbi:Rop family plasmid primer RNA-binding protein [Escherichia coli]|uniref:Rop family plasmid primer RNA-binding protein n=1 Tax=Escherichia coli TaxID=562 RepID=UPI00301BE446